MAFTNGQLAQQISDLIGYWTGFTTEYSNWLGGSASGGPSSDGLYPLTDFTGNETLVKSPAKLQADVTGQVDSAETFKDDAETAETNAAASATTATTQAGLADTSRIAAELAETNAASSESSATTDAGIAVTQANLATDRVGYAEEWAKAVEDLLVSAAAGGNQVDEYSALHHAAKAAANEVLTDADAAATAADLVLTNADVVLTHADVVLTAADVASIDIANVAHINVAESISAVWKHTNRLDLEHALPRIRFLETDAAADNKMWEIMVQSEQFILRVQNDATSVAVNVLTVDRTGTVIDGVDILAPLTAVSYGGITESDLLDKSANESIAGVYTFSGNKVEISGASPRLLFNETDAAADEKFWRFGFSAGQAKLSAINDAFGVETTVFTVDRTGTVIDAFNILAPLTVLGQATFNQRLQIQTDGTLHWGVSAGDFGRLTYDGIKAIVSAKTGKSLSMGADNTWDKLVIGTDGNVTIANALTAASYGGITESDLLDRSADESIAGAYTFTKSSTAPPAIRLNSAVPTMIFEETDASADEKIWLQFAQSGQMNWKVAKDDGTGFITYMTVDRTGTNVTSVNIVASDFDISGALTVSSTSVFTGKITMGADLDTANKYLLSPQYLNLGLHATAGGIRFFEDDLATIRGYVYYSGSYFGLLNNIGEWTIQIPHGTNDVNIIGDLDSGGAITGTSFGGITESQLLDKGADEVISGAWVLQNLSGYTLDFFTNGNQGGMTHRIDFRGRKNAADQGADGQIMGFFAAERQSTAARMDFSWGLVDDQTAGDAPEVMRLDSSGDLVPTKLAGIAVADLLDKGATEIITGIWEHHHADFGKFAIDRLSAAGGSAIQYRNDDGIKGFAGFNDGEEFQTWTDLSGSTGFRVTKTGVVIANALTMNGLIAMPNQTYITWKAAGGDPISLLTLWSDDKFYVGSSAYNMEIRGATMTMNGVAMSPTNWNTAYGWGNHAGNYAQLDTGFNRYTQLVTIPAGGALTEIKEFDGTSFGATDQHELLVRAFITGTGTDTAIIGRFFSDGGAWTAQTLYATGVSSNHPKLGLTGAGLPAIGHYHASQYVARVEVVQTDNMTKFGQYAIDLEARSQDGVTALAFGDHADGGYAPTASPLFTGVVQGTMAAATRDMLTPTKMGYTGGTYRAMIVGDVDTGSSSTAIGIGFNVNVLSNLGGAFSGDGRDMFWPRVCNFRIPNAAADNWEPVLNWSSQSVNFSVGITVENDINITSSRKEYKLNSKRAVGDASDAWLYINGWNEWTSGCYFGTKIIRTDGEIQVGASGANFRVSSGGVPTKANLGIPYHVSTGYVGGKITVASSAPGSPAKGDIWFDTT